MTTRGQIALDYNPSKSRPNTWCVNDGWDGIWLRFMEAASKEWTGELVVRYRKHARDGVFFRPVDADLTMWVSESVSVDPDHARVSFLLGGCPDPVARGLFLNR